MSREVRRGITAAASTSAGNQPVATRSRTGAFNFHQICFLCAESCSAGKDTRKVLSDSVFDAYIRQKIRDRDYDSWAISVQGRLDSVSDLFAADAVYHISCHARFCKKLPHTPLKRKRGRPKNDAAFMSFEMLCNKLEQECENDIYTLSDLHTMMMEMMKNDGIDLRDAYSKDYFKQLLQERYESHIYFASQSGRADVVGLTKFCDFLLHDKYTSDKLAGACSESERIVLRAAELIKAEIRETDYNREYYPTDKDIVNESLTVLPPLLRSLLTVLVKSPLKQAAIGQCVVQATRPEGCLMPLLFGVGVDIDGHGTQNLHTELARLGFCLSVDEIRRYKHSIMHPVSPAAVDLNTISDDECTLTSNRITHFVADNADHNIRTLDGLNTFHGMGIISTTTSLDGTFGNVNHLIRRLPKPIKASQAVEDKSVPVITFTLDTCPGVGSIVLTDIELLHQSVDISAFVNLNTVFLVAGISGIDNEPRPGWSGYMQTVSLGEHSGISDIEMLSIVDLNPSDPDCIYSTLLYVVSQASKLGLSTPDITFDQPLYIKAVDIAMKANLNIVVRLGGFHMLMSVLGSVGHMMRGSGLENILSIIYGPNTVEHVLSGKGYARAIRGHFMIHRVLNTLLFEYLQSESTGAARKCCKVACQTCPSSGCDMGFTW
jgi:hypothetical protein